MTTIAPTDRRAHINISIPLSGWNVKRRAALAFAAMKFAAIVVLNPPKAVISKLLDIPLTVLGVACVDFAAFHLAHGWGWLVTGLSLIALEFMVSDEE